MSLNCNEINLILSELSLEGAFIQDIIQPGFDTLALHTYKEGTAKTVLICTAQNSVRINETRKKMSCLVNRFAHSQAYQKTVAFQI